MKQTTTSTATRRRTKAWAVALLGGRCVMCGYDKCLASLDFHHLDPSQKDFQIGHYRKRSLMEGELKKCILICKNCHSELHAQEYSMKLNQKGKVEGNCSKHGKVPFYSFKRKNKSDKKTCAVCMRERQRNARRALKRKLLDLKGGKCESCGYDKEITALEFHHHHHVKNTDVAKIKNHEQAIKEIDLCVLLCKNCHMEHHWFDAE